MPKPHSKYQSSTNPFKLHQPTKLMVSTDCSSATEYEKHSIYTEYGNMMELQNAILAYSLTFPCSERLRALTIWDSSLVWKICQTHRWYKKTQEPKKTINNKQSQAQVNETKYVRFLHQAKPQYGMKGGRRSSRYSSLLSFTPNKYNFLPEITVKYQTCRQCKWQSLRRLSNNYRSIVLKIIKLLFHPC